MVQKIIISSQLRDELVGDDSWTEHIAQPDSGLHIGVFSLQGKRPYQEDEFAVSYPFFRHDPTTKSFDTSL